MAVPTYMPSFVLPSDGLQKSIQAVLAYRTIALAARTSVVWTHVPWAIVTVVAAGIIVRDPLVQAADMRLACIKNAAAVVIDAELSRYEAISVLRVHEFCTGLVQKVASLLR
jgi:hypothetical protein